MTVNYNERDAQALRILKGLLAHGGVLNIILPHDNPQAVGFVLPTDPRHQIVRAVTRLEPWVKGRWRAYSATGDICEGMPASLLERLTQYHRAQATTGAPALWVPGKD